MTSLIKGDQTWLMWMMVAILAAFSVWGEQKTKWGAKLGSAIIAIFGTMILVNIRVLPSASPVYSAVSTYILPLSIPLLLFQCDLKRIIKESGKLFIVFHVASLGTIVGACVAGFIFRSTPDIGGIVAMEVGAHVGGTVNLVACGNAFGLDQAYISAVAVAANLLVAFLMLFLGAMTDSKWVRKTFPHPHVDAFEASVVEGAGSVSEQYWKPKNVSLLSMALSIATTFAICGIGDFIANWVKSLGLPTILDQLFGSIYLLICTITIILVTIFPKFFKKLEGAEEIGTFMIMMYFVTIGGAADLMELLKVGVIILCSIVFVTIGNLGFLFGFGKLFKWNWEDLCNASCATIGGPTTAAAFSINKGWNAMIVPGILVGLWGYSIGNYLGILCGNLFG